MRGAFFPLGADLGTCYGLAMTVLSAAVLLFLVMDPFGNIPLFLATLQHVPKKRQRIVVVRELFIALVALVAFLFTGPQILKILHISEPALGLAGAIILFLISLKMVFPQMAFGFDEGPEGEPFVVPLAIPFVAGPSALAAVLFIMSQEPSRWPEWLLAVVLAWALSAVILFLSSGFERILGKRGLIAIERLMGMLLITISVEMFMTGLAAFLNPG